MGSKGTRFPEPFVTLSSVRRHLISVLLAQKKEGTLQQRYLLMLLWNSEDIFITKIGILSQKTSSFLLSDFCLRQAGSAEAAHLDEVVSALYQAPGSVSAGHGPAAAADGGSVTTLEPWGKVLGPSWPECRAPNSGSGERSRCSFA